MSDRTGRRAAALFLGKPLQADVDIVIDAPDALDAPGVGGVVGDAEGGDAAGGDATGGDGKKGHKTVTIPAHSSYLAARCEYFSAALGRSWQQTALGARGDCLSVGEAPASKARRLGLPLPGVTRRAAMAVLEYLYVEESCVSIILYPVYTLYTPLLPHLHLCAPIIHVYTPYTHL